MTLLWIAVALFLGQLVKGVIGFASALVAIPLLSLVLPTPDAIATVLVVDSIAGLWLVYDARSRIPWRYTLLLLVAMLPGQWVGTGLLEVLPPAQVQVVLAVVVGAMALRIARGAAVADDAEAEPSTPWGLAAGLTGGVMQGLVGMPGPPLATWANRYLDSGPARALLLSVFLPSAISAVVMLWMRGMVEPARLQEALLLSPVSIAGGMLGARIAPRLPLSRFKQLVAGVLLVSAVLLAAG